MLIFEHAQDAGSGSREHRDLGSSIKHLSGPIYASTRAPLTQRPLYGSTPFMSIEASSWTTSKSIWPSRQQYMAHSFIIFLDHQGSLQHLPLEKQVPGGSAVFLAPIRRNISSGSIDSSACWHLVHLQHLCLDRGGCILSETIVKKNVSG